MVGIPMLASAPCVFSKTLLQITLKLTNCSKTRVSGRGSLKVGVESEAEARTGEKVGTQTRDLT